LFFTVAIQYQNHQIETIIAQSKTPLEIVLIGYNLNDEDMKILTSQAINNQQYTSLKLVGNQITESSASILADALFNNKTLKRLSLWNNQVRDKGIQSLSNALSEF
jgi:Ran GTPase-activating protein (RanGAP) involved in mRNA processing and transport